MGRSPEAGGRALSRLSTPTPDPLSSPLSLPTVLGRPGPRPDALRRPGGAGRVLWTARPGHAVGWPAPGRSAATAVEGAAPLPHPPACLGRRARGRCRHPVRRAHRHPGRQIAPARARSCFSRGRSGCGGLAGDCPDRGRRGRDGRAGGCGGGAGRQGLCLGGRRRRPRRRRPRSRRSGRRPRPAPAPQRGRGCPDHGRPGWVPGCECGGAVRAGRGRAGVAPAAAIDVVRGRGGPALFFVIVVLVVLGGGRHWRQQQRPPSPSPPPPPPPARWGHLALGPGRLPLGVAPHQGRQGPPSGRARPVRRAGGRCAPGRGCAAGGRLAGGRGCLRWPSLPGPPRLEPGRLAVGAAGCAQSRVGRPQLCRALTPARPGLVRGAAGRRWRG